ncbi:MAG: PAS domain S-box protein, partial [Massilia sp.]
MNDTTSSPAAGQAFARTLGDSSSARAILARDWAATPLGPIEHWPPHLSAVVSLVMRSPVAMTLLWGAAGTVIYNDGYAEVVGAAHPQAMGQEVLTLWPEAADFNAGVLRQVGEGETLSYRDLAFELTRGGVRDRAWFNLDYSPVFDDAGRVAGVLAVVIENTAMMRALAEREAAADARRAAETRNRQILDSAVDSAIIAIDLDGLVTRWNEGARRLLGWTEEAMLGSPLDRIFTPEDQARHLIGTEMRAALAKGVGNDERWHVRQSGERFWAAGEVTPLLSDEGVAIGFVKVLRDRTEQHHAALALRESQRQLDRAQDAGGVGTFTLDLDTRMVHANRGFWRLFGLADTAAMPAVQVESLVLPEDMALRSDHQTRVDSSARLDVEYRIRRASDGAIRWIARRAEFERDGTGTASGTGAPRRMVGVVQDITERRAAEEAVRASAAQFRALAQALPDQVWTVTPEGRIDWCNDRVHQFRGDGAGIAVTGADGPVCTPLLSDDPFPVLIDEGAREETAQRWRRSMAAGAEFHTELRLRRFDGAWRWHLVRVLPLRLDGSDGNDGSGGAKGASISRWIGTATDIEERKQSEARSARDLNRIWSLSQELMLVCETGGRIVAINPAFTRHLGWSEHEMVGANVADILHPEDLETTSAELGKLAGGVPTLAFENRYRGKDEQYRLLNWTAVPDEGLVHAVARDVTRERLAE